jgi:hypothetical protein
MALTENLVHKSQIKNLCKFDRGNKKHAPDIPCTGGSFSFLQVTLICRRTIYAAPVSKCPRVATSYSDVFPMFFFRKEDKKEAFEFFHRSCLADHCSLYKSDSSALDLTNQDIKFMD